MIRCISPHCDDVVLSLGQMIAAHGLHSDEDVEVITVFAGIPDDDVCVLSPYDEAGGFSSSRDAMIARREEDRKACALLGAVPIHLSLLDRQYDPEREPAYAAQIVDAFRDLDLWADHADVFAPLGIGHPDHALVAWCARLACPNSGVALYEELPARVDWPEQVVDALALVAQDGFVRAALPDPISVGDRAMKAAAIAEYRSQFPNGADNPALLVSERVWRIARSPVRYA